MKIPKFFRRYWSIFFKRFQICRKIELGEKQNFKNFAGEPVKNPLKIRQSYYQRIMTGADKSANYEFIELYNSTPDIIDLTDWSIKRKIPAVASQL